MQHRVIKTGSFQLFIGQLKKPVYILLCFGLAFISALLWRFVSVSFTLGSLSFTLSLWIVPVLLAGVLFGPAAGVLTGMLAQIAATLALSAAPFQIG